MEDRAPGWLCRQYASGKSLKALEYLWNIVEDLTKKPETRIKAIEVMLSYGIGRPSQEYTVDITPEGAAQAFINQPTPLSREEWIAEYQRKLVAQAPESEEPDA